MPNDFRISELPTSVDFNNLDLMEVSQVDPLSQSGYTSIKKTINQIGEKIANGIDYSASLSTTSKKVIGAINEVAKDPNMSDEYDDTQTYNTGDLCIYENILYECNDDNITGAWDSTKWDATTIDAKIKSLKLSGLSDTDITTPTANQVLAYDGSKWVNNNTLLDNKQNKDVLNIIRTYTSGNSVDALNSLVTEFGKVNMMFGFSVAGVGYFYGMLIFYSSNNGGGYFVNNAGRLWALTYDGSTFTLSEK